MLEIKHLTKTYKSKGNVVTKALNDVSIKFPDTGMVFLLGKSGSGKSTLLNLCGGLDTADSGEIIVKGRSSSSFSGSDFDSYRNTFIGFVFQEYNILNEFSVEDNIALALELQGKPKDKEKIQKLLEDVDLADFAKRKPNTLSGGQKQRIAIARALIKDPEIIMADEPTGALDSTTGRQVLETLKKLSETKLVIVVSHDREFAEKYGNRIIELKDGQIISDETKQYSSAKKEGNLTLIDEHTISIQTGTSLSAKDIERINSFLKNSQEEILITNQSKDIKGYKSQARISQEGSRENFKPTKEDEISLKSYTEADARLIRSKLPLRHAAKIGTSSLKLKPIRLLFTIILSVVSFVMLGIVSTMMFYNYTDVAVNSIKNSSVEYLSVAKGYNVHIEYENENDSYDQKQYTLFGDQDVEQLKKDYGDNTIFYYNFQKHQYQNNGFYASNLSIENTSNKYDAFYSTEVIGFASINSANPLQSRIVAGHYPTSNDEIMISSFTFNSLKNSDGLRNVDTGSSEDKISLNNYDDILNKKIKFYESKVSFTVSGVWDCENMIPESFKELLNENAQGMTQYQWQEERNKGIYSLVWVTDTFYEANKNNFTNNYQSIGDWTQAEIDLHLPNITDEKEYAPVYTFQIAKKSDMDLIDFNGNSTSDTQENVIFVTPYIIESLLNQYLYSESIDPEIYDEFFGQGSFFVDGNDSYQNQLNSFLSGQTWDFDNETQKNLTPEERIEAWKKVYSFITKHQIDDLIFNNIILDQPDNNVNQTVTIGGFVLEGNDSVIITSDTLYDQLYVTDSSWTYTQTTKYKVDKKAHILGAFIYNDKNTSSLTSLMNKVQNPAEDDSFIYLESYIISSLETVDSFISVMKMIFLWAGIIIAVFSALLLFNFISVSITNKKREIGILRAVGARGIDVFKIFFSESFVIVFICFVLAIIGSFFGCQIINTRMGEGLDGIKLLVFGPTSILLILGLSVLIAVVATFLPVYSIAKKKPVDSIRAI